MVLRGSRGFFNGNFKLDNIDEAVLVDVGQLVHLDHPARSVVGDRLVVVEEARAVDHDEIGRI